jgi:hypothetical protein
MKTRYHPPQVSHPYDTGVQKTQALLVVVVSDIPILKEANVEYAKAH